MAVSAIDNSLPVRSDSKATKKKRAKVDEPAIGHSTATAPTAPDVPAADVLRVDGARADTDGNGEHPYLRELSKQVRNISKKLAGMQKVDAVLAENPGVSLDDLVAAKKINNDQRASMLKKPQLKEQLEQLESQIQHYRQFDSDYQAQLAKQKDDLTSQHEQAIEEIKVQAKLEATTAAAKELEEKILVLSQFLRLAAHKRSAEEEVESDENRAFEGALLLVYGGDKKAVNTALSLIEGSQEQVPSIEGALLPVDYGHIKQASLSHNPSGAEETWVEQVAEATAATEQLHTYDGPTGSDPTLTHAGLTELAPQHNGNIPPQSTGSGPPAESANFSGNLAGERWDPAPTGAESNGMEDSYEMVPRPQDELDTPVSNLPKHDKPTSWADEIPVYDGPTASGNEASEAWDRKAAGEQAGNGILAEPVLHSMPNGFTDASADVGIVQQGEGDGFHPVGGRHRGRGGRGRGGDGEFRGRGRGRGGARGDGESRGRGRGGFRGTRGDVEGRGGRGRGPRGSRGGGGSEGQNRGS